MYVIQSCSAILQCLIVTIKIHSNFTAMHNTGISTMYLNCNTTRHISNHNAVVGAETEIGVLQLIATQILWSMNKT